jgi:hypothetical protein
VVSAYYLCGFSGNVLPVIGVGVGVIAVARELIRSRPQGRTDSST